MRRSLKQIITDIGTAKYGLSVEEAHDFYTEIKQAWNEGLEAKVSREERQMRSSTVAFEVLNHDKKNYSKGV